jgi:hypothetical protein
MRMKYSLNAFNQFVPVTLVTAGSGHNFGE